MYKMFRQRVNEAIGMEVSDTDFNILTRVVVAKVVRKKHLLLCEGLLCKYIYYVVKGALRKYSIDQRGIEHIFDFALEGAWIMEATSVIKNAPSRYYIESMEETELLLISTDKLKSLSEYSVFFARLSQAIFYDSYFAAENRMQLVVSYSAIEKVLYFMENKREFIQRVPQNMIASYLGITPETFSRTRKQLMKERADLFSSIP
jgi:CRP-like cAMP-binding protein